VKKNESLDFAALWQNGYVKVLGCKEVGWSLLGGEKSNSCTRWWKSLTICGDTWCRSGWCSEALLPILVAGPNVCYEQKQQMNLSLGAESLILAESAGLELLTFKEKVASIGNRVRY